MADLEKARSEPKEQLWDQLDDVHAGVLGVEGFGQHMRPMAPQLDREAGTNWFYTRKHSDRAKANITDDQPDVGVRIHVNS